MKGKALTLFFLIFFVLVLADWFVTGIKNLSLNFAPNFAPANYGDNGLTEIDFNFFSKKEGWNYITQGYGSTYFSLFNYVGHWHNGIDIIARYGAPVLAAASGQVIATGNQDNFCYRRGFGKFVVVKDDELGIVTFYAHLGTIDVKTGGRIEKEARIGTIGATGYETGTHLHFSVFSAKNFQMKNKNGCGPGPYGQDLNPMQYMDKFRTAASSTLSAK